MNKSVRIILFPFLLVGIALLSWLLIHVLALFGIFLSVAYLIFWLIDPSLVPSLLFRTQWVGAVTIKRAVLNAFAIFVLSLLSVGIVVVESQLLFQVGFPSSDKSAFFNIPQRSQYSIQDRVPLEIKVSGISNPINAIQADVAFDPSMLQVEDIDVSQSFATIFVQREVDNNAGFVRLNGGLPNPGFSGREGVFATIYFTARQSGVTKVDFLPTSLILANDGYGTNILKGLSSVSYFILPKEQVSPSSEPTIGEISPSVLGVSTVSREDQLIFFEKEQSPQVLGESTTENSSSSWSPLEILRSYNQFVLKSWTSVIGTMRSIFAHIVSTFTGNS